MIKQIFVILLLVSNFVFADTRSKFLKKIVDRTPPSWMMEQIAEDLAPFKEKKITKKDLDDAVSQAKRTYGGHFLRLRISNHSVETVDTDNNAAERHDMIRAAFRWLANVVSLPACEVVISVEDSLDDVYGKNAVPILDGPIFTFMKNKNTTKKAIVIPDGAAFMANEEIREEVKIGNPRYPWDAKENKGYWRGQFTDNYCPRFRIVEYSYYHPDIIDAEFSNKNYVRIRDQLKYKYLFFVDGRSLSYARPYWMLKCNSVMFKHESSLMLWFFRALEPFVHYVPFKFDYSDIEEKINWAKQHDEELKVIVANANGFYRKFLTKSSCYYYLYLLVKEYAKCLE